MQPPRSSLLFLFAAATSTAGQASTLLVTDRNGDRVLNYDLATGALIGTFAGVGLDNPVGLTFGPDGDLFVVSALDDAVQRYDGTSGAFLGTFASVDDGRQLNFGPDGNLYVASAPTNSILRFDGVSGAPLGTFASGGGINGPTSFTFGPDGNLYVGSVLNDRIKRFDGTTGAFLGNFVTTNLDGPHDLSFGPDGHLYVTNAFMTRIQRFDGVSGAFLGSFVVDGRLSAALGLSWDDEGNLLVVNQQRNEVLRYDGTTGAFLGALVAPGTGGISAPLFACLTPQPELLTWPAIPGLAGVPNHIPVRGATPGALLELGIGQGRRYRPLPCDGRVRPPLPASLGRHRLVADESGRAGFRWLEPPTAPGTRVTTRVGEPRNCLVSSFGSHVLY